VLVAFEGFSILALGFGVPLFVYAEIAPEQVTVLNKPMSFGVAGSCLGEALA